MTVYASELYEVRVDEYQRVIPVRKNVHRHLKSTADFFELNNELAVQETFGAGVSLSAEELKAQLRLKRWRKMAGAALALHFEGWPLLALPSIHLGVYVQRVEDKTLENLVEVVNGDVSIDKAFFFRKPGRYPITGTGDVFSNFLYSTENLMEDREICRRAARRFLEGCQKGGDEPHLKMMLPQNLRANFHMVGTFKDLWKHFEESRCTDTGYEVQSLVRAGAEALKGVNPAFGEWFENIYNT